MTERLLVWRGLEEWLAESAGVTLEGERRLELVRDADGAWSVDGEPRPDLAEALDCDLGFCPLTDTMPVRRERLREGGEARDLVMAWVSVPDPAVHRSPQRSEPIDAHTVRYVSLDGDCRADLELDDDGLVRRSPRLAERLSSDAG